MVRERERKRGDLKHLSVHQWLRSAIPDSQQTTSPIGFLFLKLPPPPCAVLLVWKHCDILVGAAFCWMPRYQHLENSKKHDERKYIPRSYHPCSHLESGGFLSHGGTPKSSVLFSIFPWNKPTSFWGSPMIMDPPTLPLPWLGTAPLGRPVTAPQIDVWIIPAIQPKSSTYLGRSSSFILIVLIVDW